MKVSLPYLQGKEGLMVVCVFTWVCMHEGVCMYTYGTGEYGSQKSQSAVFLSSDCTWILLIWEVSAPTDPHLLGAEITDTGWLCAPGECTQAGMLVWQAPD